MKILITGLPYFGKKIQARLSEADKGNKYIYLNTYYSQKDRLRYLWYIWFSKCVYSINGTTGGSMVLSLAINLKKKVVLHWVGTDVLLAKKAIQENKADRRFLEYPVHLTDSPWFVNELKELGIAADYNPLLVVDSKPETRSTPEKFSVLTYIPQEDQEYYGLTSILEVAKRLPDIEFKIAGSEKTDLPISDNIKFLGWVNNMTPLFQQSIVTIRSVKHDGLSFFVLESLLHECHVIYNRGFDHCLFASEPENMYNLISDLFDKFKRKELELNRAGRDYVIREFTIDNILKLSKTLTAI